MEMMNEVDEPEDKPTATQSPAEPTEAIKNLCIAVSSEATAADIDFEQTIAVIEAEFDYKPIAFSCGQVESSTEQNQGSAKIFSFAKMAGLSEAATLQLFGRFYRDDVRLIRWHHAGALSCAPAAIRMSDRAGTCRGAGAQQLRRP